MFGNVNEQGDDIEDVDGGRAGHTRGSRQVAAGQAWEVFAGSHHPAASDCPGALRPVTSESRTNRRLGLSAAPSMALRARVARMRRAPWRSDGTLPNASKEASVMKIFECLQMGGAAGLLAVGVALSPRDAAATTCAPYPLGVPEDGATGVPTNTWLWRTVLADDASARLSGPGGEVELRQRWVVVSGNEGAATALAHVWIPEVELEPNARYRFEITGKDPWRTEFVTGAGTDVEAPPPPELLSLERGATYQEQWVTLDFEHEGILVVDAASAFEEVRSTEHLLLDTPPSREPAASLRVMTTYDRRIVFGRSGGADCSAWPTGGVAQLPARFAALDSAGNFSGWTGEALLDLPVGEEALRLGAEAAAQREAEDAEAEARRMNALTRSPSSCASTRSGGAAPASLGGLMLAIGAFIVRAGRARRHG